MKHRNLGKFLAVAASISMAISPISTLANEPNTAIAAEGETAALDFRTLLSDAIAEAERVKNDPSYTYLIPLVKNSFERRLAKAKELLANENSTNDELKTAWDKLVYVIQRSNFTGNHTDLIAEIEKAEAKNEADFTPESWLVFQAALNRAKEVNANENALDEALTAAKDELAKATTNLVAATPETPDPDPNVDLVKQVKEQLLKPAIDTTESEKAKDSYTHVVPKVKKLIDKQLAKAKEVYEKEDATLEEVELAWNNLLDANGYLDYTGDHTELAAELEKVKDLKEEDYSPASWAAFQTALAAANTVQANVNALQAQLDEAKTNLAKAVAGLTVDKTELAAAITEADAFKDKADDYTDETFDAFADALATANTTNTDADAKQKAVNDAAKALRDAIAALKEVEPADKTALVAAIEEANAVEKDKHTEESVAALEEALATANTANDNDKATQDEVDGATTALRKAIADLVTKPEEPTKADKTDLVTAINSAEAVNKDKYTEDSVKALDAALDAAKAANDKEDATQEEVDAAKDELLNAIKALQEKPADPEIVDKDELFAVIEKAQEVQKDKFTDESVAELEKALNAANAVYDKDDTTQEEVDGAKDALRAAIDALETKPEEPVTPEKADKAALVEAIEDAAEVEKDKFTEDSVKALEDALTAANEVNAKENATQDQVDKAKDDLLKAIDELKDKPVVDKTDLAKAIAEAKAVEKDNFTEDSVKVLEDILAVAEEVNAKENATQDEVNSAHITLLSAFTNLVPKPEEPEKPVEADKKALVEAIKAAKQEKIDEFTPESVAKLLDAVSAGEKVNADKDAKQEAVNKAVDDIKAAVAGLVKAPTTPEKPEEPEKPVKADKAALAKAIANAKAVNKDDFTAESVAKVEKALAEAEKVNANESAKQADVNGAATALNKALADLVKKPATQPDKPKDPVLPTIDKAALQKLHNAHQALAAKAPTQDETLRDETYKPFVEAVKSAKAVLDDKNATQEQVDKAHATLKAAYADLDQNIYRIYNPNNGEHLFTSNKHEYDELAKLGWKAEGIAWIAPKVEHGEAMTRMYDANSGEHHYTKNEAEIKALEGFGWKNEGKKWASAKPNEYVIHRLYNPNETRAGRHHYTLEDNEKNTLDVIGWNWEHKAEDLIYAKAPAKR